jgi:hypothetical protein
MKWVSTAVDRSADPWVIFWAVDLDVDYRDVTPDTAILLSTKVGIVYQLVITTNSLQNTTFGVLDYRSYLFLQTSNTTMFVCLFHIHVHVSPPQIFTDKDATRIQYKPHVHNMM